jgi:chemotaxis protein MotD
MLEASAPPADPAPRPEPSEPAIQPKKAASTAPVDPKQKPATDTPDAKASPSGKTDDKPAADDDAVAEVAAAEETPATDEALPEIPKTEETADDGSEPAAEDIVLADAQIEVVQPQPAATPQAVAVAVPADVAADVTVSPQAEGEAVPELTVKPVNAAATPAATTAPEADTAPVIDAPDLPVAADAEGTTDTPDTKGKAELKPVEIAADAADQPVNPGKQPDAPQPTKSEALTPPQAAPEDAKPKQAESTPRSDAPQPAEPAQPKPVLPHATALTADMSNNPVPTQQTTATDVAALAANNPRAALVAPTAVPVSGIAVEIATQARAGNNRFEIRLDPAELGRIDVRLDVDRDGNVKSRLVIERPDTYDLLRRDASTLERALQQAGLKTSDGAMEFTLRDQGSAQREARDQNQRNTERGIIPDADVLPAEAVSGYGRVLGLGSGVDIRI